MIFKPNNYVRNGITIGLLFPIISFIICHVYLNPENLDFSLIQLHKNFPLLWIIDTAPFVLAIIAKVTQNKVSALDFEHLKKLDKINNKLIDQNIELSDLVLEKDLLLKEVHHRVKNNLQIITGLLYLQKQNIEDESFRAVFSQSQAQISAIAGVHELLYKNKSLQKLDINEYLNLITRNLIISVKGENNNIRTRIKIPQIPMHVDTAISLGLLVTEIITNSLKYGITNNEAGSINISIKPETKGNYIMEIGDDGLGSHMGINEKHHKTLGVNLIQNLVRQLNGKIRKSRVKLGTHYTVTFQEIEGKTWLKN